MNTMKKRKNDYQQVADVFGMFFLRPRVNLWHTFLVHTGNVPNVFIGNKISLYNKSHRQVATTVPDECTSYPHVAQG